jgi:type I restriction enzyme M protein
MMSDDVYLLVEEGYKAIRDTENITKISEKKKKDGTKEKKTTIVGWEGKLVPKTLVIDMFFSAEQKAIDDFEIIISATQAELEEMIENAAEEDDEGEIEEEVKKRKKEIAEKNKLLKGLKIALDTKTRGQYTKLTDADCLKLLLERKWNKSIVNGIYALYEKVNHHIADHVAELTERYEQTLPALETEVAELESKVKSHLKGMRFVW